MNETLIAICDTDPRYTMTLSSALSKELPQGMLISSFTGIEMLLDYSKDHAISVAIVSESSYSPEIEQAHPDTLMILKETPDFAPEGALLIDRFQSREELIGSVLKFLPERMERFKGSRLTGRSWKAIGIYSPVHRCLQTTFALSLGQLLAEDHRVLYVNFENYSGLSGLLNTEFKSNMVDLLYYFDCDPDKLAVRLPLMVYKLGNLDMIPPAPGYLDTYERTGDKWVEILNKISDLTDYEYVILDLTDSMYGLLEVMEYCDRIYTCVSKDDLSKYKLAEYEKWMVDHSRADLIGKSVRFSFPQFKDLPVDPEYLPGCELAGYVKSIITEDEL